MANLDFYGVFDFSTGDSNVYEYTSSEFTQIIKSLSGTGISINDRNKFSTTASGLNLTVGTGSCLIQGRYGSNNSTKTITLDAESVSLQRIDRIVLFEDVTNRIMGVKAIKGTAGASPSAPSLTQGDLYYEIPCYRALVTNGSTVTLTDERVYVYTPTEVIEALNAKQATITGAATTITSSDLTASRALVSNSSGKIAISDITATELNHLDGTTSNIQEQINGKQSTITGGASSITSTDLTASRVLVSNSSGKVGVSAVTSTELGYVSGVTSGIQSQINGKAASSHPHIITDITNLETTLNGKEDTLNADQKRKITVSTSDPSGGADGDIWIKVV